MKTPPRLSVHGEHCCRPAQVRALVLDSLQHWALEYDIDGFCFVNAETMAQG